MISPNLRDMLSADDVMQQAYTDAFLCTQRFNYDGPGSFDRLLTTLAKRNCADAVRALTATKRGGNHDRIETQESTVTSPADMVAGCSATPSRFAAGAEARMALEAAICQLPPVYANMVRRLDLDGATVAQVAKELNRSVAIKVIFGAALESRRARFEREVQILARLRHPNIVAIRREEFGDDHSETAAALKGLARILHPRGQLPAATEILKEVYESSSQAHGDEHPRTLEAVAALATAYHDQNMLDEAEYYYHQTLEWQRKTIGDEHPHTLSSFNNLGKILRSRGKLEEAASVLREVAEVRERVLGLQHDATITSISNLTLALTELGRLTEARTLFEEAARTREKTLGTDHHLTILSWSNLAGILRKQGDLPGATNLLGKVMDGRLQALGENHPKTVAAMREYSTFLLDTSQNEESMKWARRAMDVARAHPDFPEPVKHAFKMHYGRVLLKAGHQAEAEPMLKESDKKLLKSVGANHQYTGLARDQLIKLYQSTGRTNGAEKLRNPEFH
ncbi:MAG: tetratricopeptide repeat protein [Planctomycetota bacterium]